MTGGWRFWWRARVPLEQPLPDCVHDGDTLTLEIDRGDTARSLWTLRLRNTWAPELTQAGGNLTRLEVIRWLSRYTGTGRWPFTVETYQTSGDKTVKTFARFVADVVAVEDGASLNATVTGFVTTNQFPGGTGS